jgi:hypothetical protein
VYGNWILPRRWPDGQSALIPFMTETMEMLREEMKEAKKVKQEAGR